MAASFRAGAIECLLFEDGSGGLPAEVLLANVAPSEREAALADRLEPDGRVTAPYNCLLARVEEQVVLVDAGLGPYEHPLGGAGGRLEKQLRHAGVAPEDVDVVVVTHGHLDHIGGLCRDGEPRFPRARHTISRTACACCLRRVTRRAILPSNSEGPGSISRMPSSTRCMPSIRPGRCGSTPTPS